MKPTIALLHATRSRLDQMFFARDEWWLSRADNPSNILHVFSMDEDDPILSDARKKIAVDGVSTSVLVTGMPPLNNAAWNRAYNYVRDNHPTVKIVVQVSDDFEAPRGWDTEVTQRLNAAGGLDTPLLLGVGIPRCSEVGQAFPEYSGTGDCQEILIGTLAFFAKQGWVEGKPQGFLLYPEFKSMLSDDEMTYKAVMDGTLVPAFDMLFCHHWHGDKNDPKCDSTYTRHANDLCWNVGRAVYDMRRACCHPDVNLDADVGRNVAEDTWLLPPHLDSMRLDIAGARIARGYAHIEPRPFKEDDCRYWYFKGEYRKARDMLLEQILKKYHLKVCGGRFRALSALEMYKNCCQVLGEPLPDPSYWTTL